MNLKILAISISVLIFLFVIELVRRDKLTFKYAVIWLLVAVGAVFFTVFHTFLFQCASFLGFELPSNFIFFTLFCVFIFLTLFLTVFLCQQNSRNDDMAQKIAVLEAQIQQWKKKSESRHP